MPWTGRSSVQRDECPFHPTWHTQKKREDPWTSRRNVVGVVSLQKVLLVTRTETFARQQPVFFGSQPGSHPKEKGGARQREVTVRLLIHTTIIPMYRPWHLALWALFAIISILADRASAQGATMCVPSLSRDIFLSGLKILK